MKKEALEAEAQQLEEQKKLLTETIEQARKLIFAEKNAKLEENVQRTLDFYNENYIKPLQTKIEDLKKQLNIESTEKLLERISKEKRRNISLKERNSQCFHQRKIRPIYRRPSLRTDSFKAAWP